MKLIVAVDNEWGIGLDNQLLFRIPEDMKRFRELTKGNIVVMGRKTLESLPNGEPLPNRLNIVLTRQDMSSKDNLVVCHSIEDLLQYIKDTDMEVYVIGGSEIYKQLLDYSREALVTKINSSALKDKYFPNLDKLPNWEVVEESEEHKYKELTYKYVTYKNRDIRV